MPIILYKIKSTFYAFFHLYLIKKTFLLILYLNLGIATALQRFNLKIIVFIKAYYNIKMFQNMEKENK